METIRIDPRPAWSLDASALGRAEGLAFSRDGSLLAIVDTDGARVSLFELGSGLAAAPAGPVQVLEGPDAGLDYPHDVDFSPDGRLLAVANRGSNALTFFARARGRPVRFAPRPVFRLDRHRCHLLHPDGVKFVPPHGDFVVAVNLARHALTFYRRGRWRRSRFEPSPVFELAGPETRLQHPDGCAFSSDGTRLAVSNHGADTVTIYARGPRAPEYHLEPIAEIAGAAGRLRCPHSLAFTPSGEHLAVSNAGGRSVTVHRRSGGSGGGTWDTAPVLEVEARSPGAFEDVEGPRLLEGGSKGLAFGPGCLAVSNPDIGLRIHRVHIHPA